MDRKERAKETLIEDLYPHAENLRQFGDKKRGPCPFHEDKTTPNFFIYTKTNSWYCFRGCGGGDVINFVMKLRGVDFRGALDLLV